MRRSTILTAGCLLGLFILLGQLLTRPTSGQVAATQQQSPGRFQMSASVGGVCIVDTATGQCWIKADPDVKKWTDLGSPADQKKD
jgi:hypothetical protein